MALRRRKPRLPKEPTERAGDLGAGPIEGGLISVTPDGVLGWAWNPIDPTHLSKVTLMAGDVALGTVVADLFDHELVRARVGPGIPGFLIRAVASEVDSAPIRLTLHDEEARPLGVPLFVDDPVLLGYLSPAAYEGNVDGITGGMINGWAWCPTLPERMAAVELYDGNECIDRTVASGFRNDLAAAGKREGHCAFHFDLPVRLLDSQTHRLSVRIANSDTELPGGTFIVGAQTTSLLLDELTDLRAEIKRIGEALDRVISPQGDVQVGLIRTLSERVAALAEVQRETIERELDALRAFAFGASAGLVSPHPSVPSLTTEPNAAGTEAAMSKNSKRRLRASTARDRGKSQ